MLIEIDGHSCDNCSGAARAGNFIRLRKCIQPKNCMLSYFNHQRGRHVAVWQRIVDGLHSFLNGVDIALDVPNMFVPSSGVERDPAFR